MQEFMLRYFHCMTTCVWKNQDWRKNSTWSAVDAKIKTSLSDAVAKGGQVVLWQMLASPSTEKLIAEFIGKNPNAKHVVYDVIWIRSF
jgi:hypothetical protein